MESQSQRLGILVSMVLLVGCGGSKKIDSGSECLLNSDCNAPLVCSMGTCHSGCVQTRDCPLGQSCMKVGGQAVCQLPAESDCHSLPCAGGLVCAVDYRCRASCQSGAECTVGQVCIGGVCADTADLDLNGQLPKKNVSGVDAGTVAGADAGECLVGPGGFCWSLWSPAYGTSPLAKASWVTAPSPSSAHFHVTGGADSVAGGAVTLRRSGTSVDLGKFDQMWFDADVPVGVTFDVQIVTDSAGVERPPSCTWTLTGTGRARYTVDLKSAHFCFPTACGYDRSGALSASFNVSGWGTANVLDITVLDIGFAATASGFSTITTAGSPGLGLNGWCTSLYYWGLASPAWVVPPSATSISARVTNTSTAGTGGALFELPAGQRDLRAFSTLEFDADVQLDVSTLFHIRFDGINGALCQYDRVPVAGKHTYAIDLAKPSGCQTGLGRSLDWASVFAIGVGSNWGTPGNATFTVTRLALKGSSVTPDAGVAPDVAMGTGDTRASTGGATGTGGVVGAGGATGSGGVAGAGGATGSGGSPGTGGSNVGSGGAAGARTSPDAVAYVENGQMRGAITGFGYATGGPADTILSPVCDNTANDGGSTQEITSTQACPETGGKTVWNSSNGLCISGSIPIVVNEDYTSNWGLQIGVPASLSPAYKKLAFDFNGGAVEPTYSAFRAVLHRKGDAMSTVYCAVIKSGAQVALTTFNTQCWDGTGVYLKAEDIPSIDRVGLQISSDSTSAYTVKDFCWTGMSFWQ